MLNLYTVSQDYVIFLQSIDYRTPSLLGSKVSRPFVGTVFEVDNILFFAPLTSPKEKHLKMKDTLDFIKINGGIYGAINLNNMIPVQKENVKLISLHILPAFSKQEIAYKNLLINQKDWCDKHEHSIISKAKKLYYLKTENKLITSVDKRCCNFNSLKLGCNLYAYLKTQQQKEVIAKAIKDNYSLEKLKKLIEQ